MQQLKLWLRDQGLEKYYENLIENAVDLDILAEISDEDLRGVGMPLGDRKRLLKAAASILATRGPPVAATPGFDAERRQLTVMFCDLVGSTALSTRLDAEELRDLLRSYQDACMAAVERYDGTISRAYGDGLMIYFGYPVAHEAEATRAVLAGFDIIDSVSRMVMPGTEASPEHLQVRIGIHTGLVVVGGIRPDDALDPMGVTGDTPNIAARLQENARANGMVVSQSTRRLAGDAAVFESLGKHSLKGLPEPITLFEPRRHKAAYMPTGTRSNTEDMLGRDEDMARLTSAWHAFESKHTRAALVSGPPGIGKSSLIEGLARRMAAAGTHAVQLRCSSLHTQSPFYPVAELFSRMLDINSAEPAANRLHKLEALVQRAGIDQATSVPLLAVILSIPTADHYAAIDLPPDRRMAETIGAIVRCLAALAEGSVAVLMAEDLHWMDASTLALLHHIVDQDDWPPLFVVGTFRPEFESPWAGRAEVATITLGQLDTAAARDLIMRVSGNTSINADIVDHIIATTDGVPLFIEELTKSVLEAQSLGEIPADLTTERLAVTSIPDTLQDSLLTRLDRLGDAKRVAQLGATIGREFSLQLLEAIAELDASALHVQLERLEQAELVFSKETSTGKRFAFKHALVQGAAYSTLLRRDRQHIHRLIAQSVAREVKATGVPQPLLLAHHYTEAGDYQAAVPCWLGAGENAVERHAIPEAISQLRTGLDLVAQIPDSAAKLGLELKLHIAIAMPIASVNGYTAPELGNTLERARQLCQQMGSPKQLFPVLHGIAKFYQAQADHERTESLGLELLRIAEEADDTSMRIEAHRNLGMSYALTGRWSKSVTHSDQALGLYEPDKHRSHALIYAVDPAVVALSFSSWSVWALGHIDDAAERVRRVVDYAAELEHPYSEAFALSSAATFHQLRNEPQMAAPMAQRAIEISKLHGFPYWIGWSAVPLGWAMCKLGQIEQGLAAMQQGLAGYDAAGVMSGRPLRHCLLAEARWLAGDVDGALQIIERALDFAELPMDMYRAELYRLLGDLRLAADPESPGLARAAYQQSLELAREEGAATLELRGLVSLVKLEGDAAKRDSPLRSELRTVYEGFGQGHDTHDLVTARETLNSGT